MKGQLTINNGTSRSYLARPEIYLRAGYDTNDLASIALF